MTDPEFQAELGTNAPINTPPMATYVFMYTYNKMHLQITDTHM